MRGSFRVTYFVGKRKNRLMNMWVQAENEDEARYECELRAPYIHGDPVKITITEVVDERSS